jgi:hypothetical protein
MRVRSLSIGAAPTGRYDFTLTLARTKCDSPRGFRPLGNQGRGWPERAAGGGGGGGGGDSPAIQNKVMKVKGRARLRSCAPSMGEGLKRP